MALQTVNSPVGTELSGKEDGPGGSCPKICRSRWILLLASSLASFRRAAGLTHGRSVTSSEYSVSPETIRRALKRLADMKVVSVKPQSGAAVLSADSARRYLERYGSENDPQRLQK